MAALQSCCRVVPKADGDSVALTEANIGGDDQGVITGTAEEIAPVLLELLAEHLAWSRFATSADLQN